MGVCCFLRSCSQGDLEWGWSSVRAFKPKRRKASPCCDTRPASRCQGLFFLSQSFINIHVNKQKHTKDFKTSLLFKLNWQWNISHYTYSSWQHRKERYLLSRVQLFVTPWTVAHQAPLSTGFPRQEYWSGLPLPSPGDLPDPRTEPTSLESSVTCITTSTLFNLCVSLSDHTLFKVLSM